MVFTPLLAATTVGTLDPRSVTVHVTQIQKALHEPQNQFYMASCENVNIEEQKVECEADGVKFDVHYDKLAICTGSQVWMWIQSTAEGMYRGVPLEYQEWRPIPIT